MTAREKLTKARVMLILGQPFFASIAMGMDIIEDTSQKTAATDGKNFYYNPKWIDELSLDETTFVFGHEVMHVTQLHHLRMGNRKLGKWNSACDYAINPLLAECGFIPFKGAYLNDTYQHMSAEQIYNLLPDEDENQDGEGDSDPGGCGGVLPSPAQGQAEREQEEQEVRRDVTQAMNNARKQGKLPEWLERVITKAIEPKVDWKETLARFLSDISRDDYTYKKPNTRYIHTGFFLPFLENETIGEIILIVDTSGSIDEELLNKFGGEMQDIVNTFGKGFHVVYVDATVKSSQYIEPDGPVQLKPSGGGGTDFKPGFEWIDKQEMKPKTVVYFTDGICWSFPETPDYPVLWAIYGGYDFDPPFGETVNILE